MSRFPDDWRGGKRVMTSVAFWLSGVVALATALGAIGPALAQVDPVIPPDVIERMAFDAADTDDDGYVSEAELARDAAAGFSGLDTNRDERLTPGELAPHDPAWFARVDRDGDGVLTFDEVMTNKIQGIEAGDKNGDGRLSFEEMVNEVAAEEGVR